MQGTEMVSDIAISGSGVTGLWIARKLAVQSGWVGGLEIVVLEKSKSLADGASTKNEGWLHAGTYHGFAIKDPAEAATVVRKTKAGYNQTLGLVPDCIEYPRSRTYALTSSIADTEWAVNRWNALGVGFEEVTRREIKEAIPNLNPNNLFQGFRVDDKSINTRVLYDRLYRDCRRLGVKFFTQTRITDIIDETTAKLESDTVDANSLKSAVFIHATGSGLGGVLDMLGYPQDVRYWKSHLMVTPRIAQHNIFYLREGEIGVMHHRDVDSLQKSVVGTNKDGIFMDEPNFEVDRDRERYLREAMGQTFLNFDSRVTEGQVYSCVKLDTLPADSIPKLSTEVLKPLENHFCVLPGKMTEAPYAADEAVRRVMYYIANYISGGGHPQLHQDEPSTDAEIALRPCDRLEIKQTPLFVL